MQGYWFKSEHNSTPGFRTHLLRRCKSSTLSSTLCEPPPVSSPSCRTASTDLSDPLSPPVSIVYRSRDVFHATSCIGTELLYIGSCWLTYICSSMWMGPLVYIAYEFILTSPAVLRKISLFKSVLLLLKIDFKSHSARGWGFR